MRYFSRLLLLLPIVFAASCDTHEQEESALPTVETLDATEITRSTVVLNGRTTGGVENMLSRGVCFGLSEQISYEDKCISVGKGEGVFSAIAKLSEQILFLSKQIK